MLNKFLLKKRYLLSGAGVRGFLTHCHSLGSHRKQNLRKMLLYAYFVGDCDPRDQNRKGGRRQSRAEGRANTKMQGCIMKLVTCYLVL